MLQNNRVFISRQSARSFFEEARHPDPEMMRRRDDFFSYLDTQCIYRHEGANLVMEIPDLDVEAVAQHGVVQAESNWRASSKPENPLVMDIPDEPLVVIYAPMSNVSYESICEMESNDYPVATIFQIAA